MFQWNNSLLVQGLPRWWQDAKFLHSLVLIVIINGLDMVKVYIVLETFYYWRWINKQVLYFQMFYNLPVTMDTIKWVEVNGNKIFTNIDVNSFTSTITFVSPVPRSDSASTIMVEGLWKSMIRFMLWWNVYMWWTVYIFRGTVRCMTPKKISFTPFRCTF